MTVTIRCEDRCTAPDDRKPEPETFAGASVSISGDAILLDGTTFAARMEPHGLGDVHWEIVDPDRPIHLRRFTHMVFEFEP